MSADSLSLVSLKNSVSVVLNTTSWDLSLRVCCLCETFCKFMKTVSVQHQLSEHNSLNGGLWCMWCNVTYPATVLHISSAFFLMVKLCVSLVSLVPTSCSQIQLHHYNFKQTFTQQKLTQLFSHSLSVGG